MIGEALFEKSRKTVKSLQQSRSSFDKYRSNSKKKRERIKIKEVQGPHYIQKKYDWLFQYWTVEGK